MADFLKSSPLKLLGQISFGSFGKADSEEKIF
jgi:hypothetical protein